MRISMDTYALSQKFGDFKAIEMMKEAGFDAVDFSYCYKQETKEVLGDGYREYAKRIREHLDKVGIVCNQAHAPFVSGTEFAKDASLSKETLIIRAIESASILGAENIVVHALLVPEGVDFEETNINYYKSLIPYCEKFGIRVAVENLFKRDFKRKSFAGLIGSPKELNRIVEKINSPYIVACVDVGHSALTGNEPEKFIEGVNKNILKVLHVHDNGYTEDDHALPYTGKLNWEAVMEALKNKEYQGDLTFEIRKFTSNFPDELVAQALKFIVSVGKHLVSIYNK